MLRIIGGSLGGRVVPVRVPSGTRPTAARVREAIFAMVEARVDLEGARVVDLFAGAGGLTFEALSRGAACVVWVDRDARLAADVRRAADALEVASRLSVRPTSVERFLASEGRSMDVDVVFVDPPYVRRSFEDLGPQLPNARWVVVEAASPVELGERWRAERWRRYGGTQVGLFVPAP
ncbi:methyltransferase [Acidimicrobium ferrooxidans DSM 10331]|uniref:Methyltransferase n=1 Tax=Acidimicrobium ferrooxidans (strain DSM 10331 / JCM 15462 / NBRC 103882 / ICP) TaxID=525909 RepID=C7M0D0_ACIFD|nr:RsmD family RNA methyltransferase [Acidimicrobium ferrooxidans]ACU54438.1 methyltransferase [Acidimicrobium ferrooxidans DSM 10331]